MESENSNRVLIADPKKAAAQARNVALNVAVGELDKLVKSTIDAPEMQMGILAIAQSLAFRRLLATKGDGFNRGKRYKLLRLAVQDVEAKLREFALDYVEPERPAEEPKPD